MRLAGASRGAVVSVRWLAVSLARAGRATGAIGVTAVVVDDGDGSLPSAHTTRDDVRWKSLLSYSRGVSVVRG